MIGRFYLRRTHRLWAIVCVAGLMLMGLAMWFEERIIFPAPRYPEGDWQPVGFAYEDVSFQADDGTSLHGWYFANPDARGHLLYCHGNGDCVAYLGEYADQLRRRYGLDLLIFDYRGYGRSGGTPGEAGVLRDARAARDWLADRVGCGRNELILMGRSLGGAVVIDLAADAGARALILQNTFTSMVDVAQAHFPWYPARYLLRTRFDSLGKVARYRGPVLQSHASADEVIPFRLGQRLFEAIPGPKEFYVCAGRGHNMPEPAEYDALLGRFLDGVLDVARVTKR